MRKRLLSLIALAVVAAAILVATSLRRPPPASCERCNVVVVLADTLRADHMSSYGYPRATSPFLDDFARRNVLFEQARSQASCTFPSVNSLLTSRYPAVFTGADTRPGIPAGMPSLPRVLQAEGYTTVAVSASPIVRRSPGPHNPVGGFGEGFDVFDEFCVWRESTCVTTRALRQLEDVAPPFLLYVHYMDPHDPYRPLPQYRGLFAGDYTGEHRFVQEGDPNPIQPLVRGGEVGRLSADDVRHLVDRYDEEIRSLDSGVARLLAVMEHRGLLHRTVVALASDHGEEFLEHGSIKHCYTVFDTEIRVPLLLRVPGVEGPLRPSSVVQNLDLVPTLLDYLGIEAPDAGFQGRSLRPLIEQRGRDSVAFSAMGVYRAAVGAGYKLIYDARRGRYTLFDLRGDPGERQDVLGQRRGAFRTLRLALESWMLETEAGIDDGERRERAEEIEEELRALGYLG